MYPVFGREFQLLAAKKLVSRVAGLDVIPLTAYVDSVRLGARVGRIRSAFVVWEDPEGPSNSRSSAVG